MIVNVKHFIHQAILFYSGTPVLVACSGGVDSMVLCEVLLKLNFKIAIAHCNFQLRGKESIGDALFVEQYALQHNISFPTIAFDTNAYKNEKKISTQMAARALRYEWFEKIRKENNYHKIITAHHLDDQIETILLNMAKGTGINGLTGMQALNQYIARPFLAISKQEIAQFATVNNIQFREDSSNESDDYQRNKIRHHIVPILNEINPNFYSTALEFVDRMNDYALLTQNYIDSIKKKCYSEKKVLANKQDKIVEIKLGFIKSHKAGKTVLFHLIKEFGFNDDTINNIFSVKESGKQFFSDAYRLVVDRNSLFILPKNVERENYLVFDKWPTQIQFNNYTIQCAVVPFHELNIKNSSRYAYFDADKIEFPLTIRYAKESDYFYPFGMSKPKSPEKVGKKKLSKYFKDGKFSLIDKENTAVIFSGEKLLWLVNHRIDDRFKVNEKTKAVIKLLVVATD